MTIRIRPRHASLPRALPLTLALALTLSLAGCGGGGGSPTPTRPTAALPGEMRSATYRCETATLAWGGGLTASATRRALVTVAEPAGRATDSNHALATGFAATILYRP